MLQAKMEDLCKLIARYSLQKCPAGGHYAFEAGYKDSLLKRMVSVPSTELSSWIDAEITWVSKQLLVMEAMQ